MHGYYRFPTIFKDQVVFTADDDLWSASIHGGLARRLTAGKGSFSHPHFSPDGTYLAFIGREEGYNEVYTMPAKGGMPERLTFLDSNCHVVGWHPRTNEVIFASNTAQPFSEIFMLYTIGLEGGLPRLLPVGSARSISFGPQNEVVIGRNAVDLAYWKRYRGGKTGEIWIDLVGNAKFRKLLKLKGNLAWPMWVNNRIYFLSDHEGIGNIYSCNIKGKDIQRHTNHVEFYVRYPSTDGKQIVYQNGADIYHLDIATNEVKKIPIEFYSSTVQKSRKFVSSDWYLEHYDLQRSGKAVAITTRGKAYAMFNWEGGVYQLGQLDGVRYRLVRWLNNANRLLVVSDATGEELLELHHLDGDKTVERLDQFDIGRTIRICVAPHQDILALSNHRMELLLIDINEKKMRLLDKSDAGGIGGLAWSPDGKWLVYSKMISLHLAALFLCKIETGEIWQLTNPVLRDVSPAFDPEGKYIYFLSYRSFEPISDNVHFDLSFPLGIRPYLITLQKDLPSPFEPPLPKISELMKQESEKEDKKSNNDKKEDTEPGEKDVVIDLEGIQERVLPFPVPEGRYYRIMGIKRGALYTYLPVENLLKNNNNSSYELKLYNFEERKEVHLAKEVSDFSLSRDYKTVIYRSGRDLRVVAADEKEFKKLEQDGYSKESGWINLRRIRVSVIPAEEWRQMFREAWRLQRDYFWTEDMAGVDWNKIYERYLPLTERVCTRSEIADLIAEMQGELGTSHTYEYGGDYRSSPRYRIGFLGADFEYDEKAGGYRLTHIVQGDPWNQKMDSPLRKVGTNIQEGDVIVAINNQPLSKNITPNQVLVNHADQEVYLTIKPKSSTKDKRLVCVKTLRREEQARYREWVEKNRAIVHKATAGRVGYVHIPDMGESGYAEFHRYFLAEIDREGLIVDIRFNRGGYVSELILEKLTRRRLGYDKRRWGTPIPYPYDSLLGPVVAIANEFAGSDGDIFAHGFKLLKLGPLVGKRTWGGVIGINIRTSLVDGGITTQPEYFAWFQDIGWKLENFGTEPDIEVDIKPQDYIAGKDPQLKRSLKIILDLLQKNPPKIPDFGKPPRLNIPGLPGSK